MTTSYEPDGQLIDTAARLLAGTESSAVPTVLADLGWTEMWNEDREPAARALFGQQGRLARTSPMLSLLVGAEIADGNGPTAALIAPPSVSVDDLTPAYDGSAVMIAQVDALAHADWAIAGIRRNGEEQLVRVPVAALSAKSIAGLDPDLHLGAVDMAELVKTAEPIATGPDAAELWSTGCALGRRLLVEEMSAIVAEQLRLTVEHAISRTQFGRAIGSYQAVKHKLAEVHVAVQTARLAAQDAWADQRADTALVAKIHAGDAVETANRHCLQVLGGIGFTWEHPFHRYYRRGRVLDALFGSTHQLSERIGQMITAHKAVPPITELEHYS